jgi:NAD(P)-dependent dehydrogenase (short-subunit alcohol dehydrogenase family)
LGKVIAITGAGDGLGRALARRFAADGETVILLGRTPAKIEAVADELLQMGGGAPHRAIACDVTDPASVRAAFAEIGSAFGRLDVLINNAGVFEPFTLAEVRDDQIASLIGTNLAGPIACSREALPLLKASAGNQLGGHIINVSSETVALQMPLLWLYGGTKAALEYMSEMWAKELARDGVRVTVVRAGQMMDETKTGSAWPAEVAIAFATECAKIGLNLRERPISHYDSATQAFRAVIDTPPDLHIAMVAYNGHRAPDAGPGLTISLGSNTP